MNGEDNNQDKGGLKNTVKSAQKAVKTIDKIKKSKVAMAVISAVAPILGWFLLIILIITIVMLPIMYLDEIKEKTADSIDKFINFITLEGWGTSELKFFQKLEVEYGDYSRLNNKEGEFDIPLIAATIHYSTLVAPDSYNNSGEYNDDDESSHYKYDSSDPVIPDNQLRGFYVVANDKLGSTNNSTGLLGHLVDIKFTTTCAEVPGLWNLFSTNKEKPDGSEYTEDEIEAQLTDDSGDWASTSEVLKDSIEDFLSELGKSVGDGTTQTLKKISIIRTIRLIYSYSGQGESYFKQRMTEEMHGDINDNFIARLFEIIENSDLTSNCSDGQWPIPVTTKYINYERYKTYLRDYLPIQSFSTCPTCDYALAEPDDEKQKAIIENMITEIFEQKEAYQYLKGNSDLNNAEYSEYIPGLTSFPVPLNSAGQYKITSRYGMRIHPISKKPKMHKGIDIGGMAIGVPVYSIADGEVVHAGCQSNGCMNGYGKYIKIKHDVDGNGTADYYTLYAHLSVINTVKGAFVGGSQKIGEIGSTGSSTGPHLHLEIRDANDNPVNPEPILNGIISGDSVFDSDYVYYNQGDYAHIPYCPGMHGASIKSSGCLPTSYAMVARRLGKAESPISIVNYICQSTPQYRIEGSGSWSAFFTDEKVMKHFGIKATRITNLNIDTVISHLRSGKTLIANVKKGYFTNGGHYLVIDYIDNNDRIYISDPASRTKRTRWYSKEEFQEKLMSTARNIWYFEGVR